MLDCIFCKIIKGELLTTIIYEDEDIFSFLSDAPVNKGHTLVIPKEHHESILDTPDDLLGKVAIASKKVGQAIVDGLQVEGLNMTANNGAVAGQEIFHLHFHLIPRLLDDGLKQWAEGVYDGDAQEYADKIKAKL